METPNVPVVPGSNQTPPPVQSPSPLHDKGMKWNILIGGGLLVVGLFSYFLAGGGIFKGQIKLASNNLEQMSQANIDELGKCIDFKQSQTHEQVKSNLTVQEIKLKKGGCPNGLFVAVAAGQGAVGFMHSSINSEADKSGMTYAISYKTNADDGLVTLDYGDGTEVVNISPNNQEVKVDEANKTFTIKHTYSNEGPYKITATQEVGDMKDKDGKQLYLTATQDIEVIAANVDAEAAAKEAAPVANISNFSATGDVTIPANEKGAESISFSKFGLSLDKGESQINGFTLNVAVEDPANIGDIRNILIYDGGLKIGGVISPVIGANTITFSTPMQISSSIKELTIIANFNKVTADGVYKITLKGVNFSDDKVTMDPAAIKELSEDKYFASKTSKVEMATAEGLEKKVAVYNSSKNNEVYFETSESKMQKVLMVADFEINTDSKHPDAEIPYLNAGFKDISTPQDQIKQWDWDFGNGKTDMVLGPLKNPPLKTQSVYTYKDIPESYPVKLTVTYFNGAVKTTTHNIDVPAKTVAAPAAIDISNNLTVSDPEWDAIENKYKVVFTLVPNFGNNGMKTYSLNFGDGQTPYSDPKLIDTHFYTATGAVQPLQAILTIVDHDGKTFTATKTVKIPAAPLSASAYLYADSFSADIGGKGEGMPGETVKYGDGLMIIVDNNQDVVISALHFITDMKEWAFDEPRKDNLPIGGAVVAEDKPIALKAVCSVTPLTGITTTEFTFSGKGSTGPITSGRWDFGDKTPSGQLTSASDKTKDFKHTYATAGTYTASLEIVDSKKIPNKCEKTIVVSAAEKAGKPAVEKTAAEKAASQPATPATPAQPVGNTTINNYYNTTTNTTTPAAPAAPAAPTEGISRSVISPTIFAEKPTGSKLCSGLVDTKSPIVLDDTLNSTVGFLTQLKYKNDRVINGYNLDGKVIFNAAKEITKAEFLKILFYGSCMNFTPTTTGNWYDGIWEAAVKKGLVISSDDPNSQLTIREAIVILSKVATVNKAPSTFKQYFVDVAAKDKDYSKFQDMAYNNIYLGRLVNGERRADPSGLVLREVAASILNNYLSK